MARVPVALGFLCEDEVRGHQVVLRRSSDLRIVLSKPSEALPTSAARKELCRKSPQPYLKG